MVFRATSVLTSLEAMEREPDMAINEDLDLGLEEQPQHLPPGIERRAGRRSSGEPQGRASGREQGALRIRLSDNELRAAQLIQERFQLRSTVAALGFCLRTMAQMVEQGQVGEETTAAQLPQHTGPGRRRGGQQPKNQVPAARPDPFARPVKQQPQPVSEDQPPNSAAPLAASTADDCATDSSQSEEA
ncbi:MAG TPA: hypothetical protein DD643_05230 [Synechococcus sp. UBA8638]|nr:hypothetical protein [Synechococcus sp. UBA8638]